MKKRRTLVGYECDICGDEVEIYTDAMCEAEGYDGDTVKCVNGHRGYFVVTEDEAYCEWD